MRSINKFLFSIVLCAAFLLVADGIGSYIAGNTCMHVDLINAGTKDESFGYFIPNQNKTVLFPGLSPYQVEINDLGLRTCGLNINRKNIYNYKKRILCVGDSITFGLFVDNRASYPYKLQQIMVNEGKKDVAVLNAGIGSTTISDHYYYLKEKGLKLKPDLVIINFCQNDIGELKNKNTLYEKILNENKNGWQQTIKRMGIMRVFRKLYVSWKYKRWLNKISDPRARRILQNESQNMDDIIYAVKAYHVDEVVKAPYAQKLKPAWEKYNQTLKKTVNLLKENGIDVLVVINPEFLSVAKAAGAKHEDIIKKFMDNEDINYIDFIPIFAQKNNILSLYNRPPRDFHLSDKGSKIVAETIYQNIKNNL